MGKQMKRSKINNRRKLKVPMSERARKMKGNGTIKKKRGDLKMVSSRKVAFKVKQKKGGKWVKVSGVRECKIHTVCDCVTRTDPALMKYVNNR